MKTIALLWIGAALVCAQDQSQNQKQKSQSPKDQSKDKKAAMRNEGDPTAAPLKARDQAVAVPSNPHRPTVEPAPQKATPEQKASAALPTVPPAAKEVGPNLFRYTDAQGKNWMYRNTPFGVSKWEEKPGEQEPHAGTAIPAGVTMTDLGDSVQFNRLTPLGIEKWTRKKSEMTDAEKAAFASQEQAKPDASKPPEKQ